MTVLAKLKYPADHVSERIFKLTGLYHYGDGELLNRVMLFR